MPSQPPLLDAITRSLHHLATRQRVVAENIANSETPHFRARDVRPPDFGALLERQIGRGGVQRITPPQVVPTEAMVALGVPRPADRATIRDRATSETKPDGNTVSLEDQLLKMGQIRTDFAAMTNLYRKQLGLINGAIGHGN
ncbi:flagellar biosynthesis protein FlgB [Sphingomonas morindae]|uniref:Flagellar biosynthesis protein FlgB n=1 Tax=Sphingomonas morindae TaxID=1541170 RepID=A0ABY4X8M9_9SPHN|nr:flagellar biosynthesis protein FlgB [Sphingomonas morindae]USI73271.1 flagellar biosynthesis protein FlgB [Sphingomonas morindae]